MRPLYMMLVSVLAHVGCSADAADTGSHPAVASSAGASSGGSATTGSSGSNSSAGTGMPLAGSTSTNGGSNGATAGTTSTSGGNGSAQKPLSLPFFVNAPGNFVKSGFMGDAMASVTAAPSELLPDGTCGGKRAAGMPGGDCDTFKVVASATGLQAWQGVFYQFPANNWGSFPGRMIATGAKSVKFQAYASRSVAVLFQVGMCDPLDPQKCADGFYAYPDNADTAGKVMVGSEWTAFSVSLAGKDYSEGVRGAFSWAISNDDLLGDLSELDLYLDAISWE